MLIVNYSGIRKLGTRAGGWYREGHSRLPMWRSRCLNTLAAKTKVFPIFC